MVFSSLGRFRIDTYTVKVGDTLWSISKSFNITVDELVQLNGLQGSLIYKGQILKIM
ncbi:LysM peptidoglycan-binding domain-containing protein [Crassaminicella indica]|uniref:LysM peptidoglycan-binding domain-containing protein n=1 Tax=Crassaminicella indica TaxID=2855394 RepID=A0ABX8R8X0_9CLOT|nr:LysM peptidoglycan-binding domain-containing protein [Crassaminicella indica]QXM05494.1 LysM peptidoglycan-binding domain-containing protein [Crassaminicella indica]